MTVTILPGQDNATDPGAAPPDGPGRRRVALAAAVGVVAAAALGGAWMLTRSDPEPAATVTSPAPHPSAAPVTSLPAHGPVSKAQRVAVAVPAFAAMNASLGGWAEAGRVHVPHESHRALDNKVTRCAGMAQQTSDPGRLESGKYTSGAHEASGEISLMASAAAARHDLARLTAPHTAACAERFFLPQFRSGKMGDYVTTTGLSMHRLRAVPHAFRMKIVVGYVVDGREIPVQLDFVGAVVGRAEVSLSVTSRDAALAPSREVAALRAMTQVVERSLR